MSLSPTPARFPEVSGYQILRLLGAGGMAEVYQAIQISLDRQVALKVLSANSGAASEAISRFEQEAQLIARLSHPHIVGIHDIGRTASGALYYAMPYLPQGDLERHAGPLPEAEVIGILDALASALEHAHAMGVIHRDIKPANVLFDRYQRPLLADFGVALNVVAATRVTGADNTVGSAGYMSPEQSRAWPVDGRSDLYSLGAVAFELLTGRRPFPGEDPVAVAIAQWEQAVPRLPAPLRRWQAWIDRALARRPEDRFQTASALRAALPKMRPGQQADAARPTWFAGREAVAPLTPTRRQRLLTTHLPTLRSPGRYWVLLAIVLILVVLGWRLLPLGPQPTVEAAGVDVQALIEAGQLWPPARPNALELLGRIPIDPAEARRFAVLRLRLVEAMQARLATVAEGRDWVGAEDALRALTDAARAFELPLAEIKRESARRLGPALNAAFAESLATGERRVADPALKLSGQLPLDPALAARRHQVVALSQRGQDFFDPGGPEMQVLRPAAAGHPGLAVSKQPVTPAQWAEFSQQDALRTGKCKSSSFAQTCLGLAVAESYAQWLSKRTGASYRLPSRREWALASGQIKGPAGLWLWTKDCHLQTLVVDRPNALERGLGSIRSVFGGSKPQARTETRCAGQFVSQLADPKQTRVEAKPAGAADIALVLVRTL